MLPSSILTNISSLWLLLLLLDDFWEGDEDSNFSVFRVRRFNEWPEPLHWIAFLVEIPTKPLIHWIASPLFTEEPFLSLRSASSRPLPKNRLWCDFPNILTLILKSQWSERFLDDFSACRWIFWDLNLNFKNRCSRLTQKCAQICGKICCAPTACPGRGPYSISAALSRRHVTQ